jgi:PleD family two-component response regulator
MEKIHALLVDRHPEAGDLFRQLLDQHTQIELDLTHVPDFAVGKPVLEGGLCDLVLFDLDPKTDGSNLEDLEELVDVFPRLPIVVLMETSDPDICLAAIKNGAQDYLIKKQMNVGALFMAIIFAIERKKRETELLYLANHDPLTGLPNRRLFSDRLERGMKRFYRKTDNLRCNDTTPTDPPCKGPRQPVPEFR